LQLAVTVPVIVAAKWTRDGRETEREFIMPLRVCGEPAEVIPKIQAGMTAILDDLVVQIQAAQGSSERGYTYRFPRGELLEHVASKLHAPHAIPDIRDDQRDAMRRHLASDSR
jgi:hypothetical protein